MDEKNDHTIQALVAIGRIEGKLDAMAAQQHKLLETDEKHDGRIGSLEQDRSKLIGIGIAAGAFSSWITNLIMGKH
jgi:hypothetical protein